MVIVLVFYKGDIYPIRTGQFNQKAENAYQPGQWTKNCFPYPWILRLVAKSTYYQIPTMLTQSTPGTVRRPQAVKENRRNTNASTPPVKVTYQRKPMAYKGKFEPPAKKNTASIKSIALHPSSLVKYLLKFVSGTWKKQGA